MSSWERTWQIRLDTKQVLSSKTPPLDIELKKKKSSGLTYYKVKIQADEYPEEWDDCRLVPRGTLPCEWYSQTPLPPWDPNDPTAWDARIKTQLESMNTSTRRLEGELDYGYTAKMVYFFKVNNAITGSSGRKLPLILVKVASNLPWNPPSQVAETELRVRFFVAVQKGEGSDSDDFRQVGDPIEDGTAQGNPK